jgi:hypothetical protein
LYVVIDQQFTFDAQDYLGKIATGKSWKSPENGQIPPKTGKIGNKHKTSLVKKIKGKIGLDIGPLACYSGYRLFMRAGADGYKGALGYLSQPKTCWQVGWNPTIKSSWLLLLIVLYFLSRR